MNRKDIYKHGSAAAELDRTAEMVVDLHKQGKIASAIWLIHDGNRFDAASMKFLAERVEAWSKSHPRTDQEGYPLTLADRLPGSPSGTNRKDTQ